MLRGESAYVLSRKLNVEIYRLEQWRKKALSMALSSIYDCGGKAIARGLSLP